MMDNYHPKGVLAQIFGHREFLMSNLVFGFRFVFYLVKIEACCCN